ncbi:MAG: dienelactone hydrolase family protein [Ferruginibacter sp.]
MFRRKLLLSVIIILVCFNYLAGQDLVAFTKHSFTDQGQTLLYRLLQPLNFDSSKKYPLVIFLHGAGLKGNDNESQLKTGASFFLQDSNRLRYPAYVLFPQCPVEDLWNFFEIRFELAEDSGLLKPVIKESIFPFNDTPTTTTRLLLSLADSLRKLTNTDTSRLYIGGISQGGMGVWDIVARKPGWFAAAFPICGMGNTDIVKHISKATRFWIFHGAADDVIPAGYSRQFYKKLQRKGYQVKYTEYPGVKHDCWNHVFAEKDLLPWMFGL